MSHPSFGITVPTKHSSSLESFCKNNNINLQLWNAEDVFFHGEKQSEYLFYSDKDRAKAAQWIDRLNKLDKQ